MVAGVVLIACRENICKGVVWKIHLLLSSTLRLQDFKSRTGSLIFSVILRWNESLKRYDTLGELSTLINPGIRIPAFITQLTGITNNMVKDAPAFSDAALRSENLSR